MASPINNQLLNKTPNSPPEFVIRRNEILQQKRTSSVKSPIEQASLVSKFVHPSSSGTGIRSPTASKVYGRQTSRDPISNSKPCSSYRGSVTSQQKPHAGVLLRSYSKMGEDSNDVNNTNGSINLADMDIKVQQALANKVNGKGPQRLNGEAGEEFSYGPGFVDKLKSRFIKLSLSDKTKMTSAGNLRRFSSLENVLDSDEFNPTNIAGNDVTKRKRTMPNTRLRNRGTSGVQNRNSFKRAKSMETLLMDQQPVVVLPTTNGNSNKCQRPLSMIDTISGLNFINENVVIIESPPKMKEPPKDHVVPDPGNKKITPNRQVSNISDEELPKPDTVKTYKLFFEPVPGSGAGKRPPNQTRKVPASTQRQHCAKNNLNNKTGAIKNSNVTKVTPLKMKGAKENNGLVNGSLLEPKKLVWNNLNDEAKITNTVPPPPVVLNKKPVADEPKKLDIETNVEKVVSTLSKPELVLTPSPTNEVTTQKTDSNGTLEANEWVPVVTAASIKIAQPATPTSPLTVVDSQPIDEISDHNEEVEDSLKPTALLGNKKSSGGGLWGQKNPPSAQMTTTIVYNFVGKEVKSHLPANPTPFGCKSAGNLRKGKEGFNFKNNGTIDLGEASGESKDYDSDDDVDELDIGAHLPNTSGITFEGENVTCPKSSMLSRRNKNQNIIFVEAEPSVFVYPSEDSVYDDPGSPVKRGSSEPDHRTAVTHNGTPPNSSPEDEDADLVNHDGMPQTQPGLRNTPIGGALSNYTPSMLSSADSFQLGVSRSNFHTPEGSNKPEGSVQSSGGQEVPKEEELLPADSNETSSWSSSETPDLLF